MDSDTEARAIRAAQTAYWRVEDRNRRHPLTHTERLEMAIRAALAEAQREPTRSQPLRDMSDGELTAEWQHWDDKIAGAKSWGAALAAANEFRKDVETELRRRGLEIPPALPTVP